MSWAKTKYRTTLHEYIFMVSLEEHFFPWVIGNFNLFLVVSTQLFIMESINQNQYGSLGPLLVASCPCVVWWAPVVGLLQRGPRFAWVGPFWFFFLFFFPLLWLGCSGGDLCLFLAVPLALSRFVEMLDLVPRIIFLFGFLWFLIALFSLSVSLSWSLYGQCW